MSPRLASPRRGRVDSPPSHGRLPIVRGAHLLLYSKRAEEVRAFLRDTLGLKSVDAGEGWLIFALPPAEVGVHPTMERGDAGRVELHLMCDDLPRTMASLKRKGVRFTSPVANRGYGLVTALRLPDGTDLGLYQPRHTTAIRWPRKRSRRARAPRRKASAARRASKVSR